MTAAIANRDPVADAILGTASAALSPFELAARASSTRQAYAGDWRRFVSWCHQTRRRAMPAEPHVVQAYLEHLAQAGRLVPTIRKAHAAIVFAHHVMDVPAPLLVGRLKSTVDGIVRTVKLTPRHQASALLPDDLRRVVASMLPNEDERRRAQRPILLARDMAVLCFGMACGFRRSEFAKIRYEHISSVSMADRGKSLKGYVVHLTDSKSDQPGLGHDRTVWGSPGSPTCPVSALDTWLAVSGIRSGPVFRSLTPKLGLSGRALSGRSVDRIVRDRAAQAGLTFSSHSLRSGFVTAAGLAGKPLWEAQQHVGHRSSVTTARYYRRANARSNTAAKDIGL